MNWNSLELVRQIREEDDISGGRYFVVASQEAMVSMRDWGNYQQCRVCHEVSAAGCLSESHAPPVSQGKIPNNRSQLICPLVSILRPEHFLWCESANDGLFPDEQIAKTSAAAASWWSSQHDPTFPGCEDGADTNLWQKVPLCAWLGPSS